MIFIMRSKAKVPYKLKSFIFILFTTTLILTACSKPLTAGDDSKRTQQAAKLLNSGLATAKLTLPYIRPISNRATPHLPVHFHNFKQDYTDKITTVTDVSRIISVDMYGTLSQIVFSLGLGKNVVGRDTSTDFPEARNLPKIMSQPHVINIESVLKLHPTVFLTDGSTGPASVYKQLKDLHIPIVFFDDKRSLENNSSLIQAVADSLGVSDLGKKLVQRTENEIKISQQQIPAATQILEFAFLYLRGKNTMLIFGDGLGAGSLITALGATNAADKLHFSTEYQAINSETLASINPNLVLVMTQGADSIGGIKSVLNLPGMSITDAGSKKRVVQMDQNLLLTFGPNIGLVLSALSKVIYHQS